MRIEPFSCAELFQKEGEWLLIFAGKCDILNLIKKYYNKNFDGGIMIGLSLPYGWLRRDGGLLDLSELLPLLKQRGAHSIEIRTVPADADTAEVLRVAELLWSYGLHITVHGNVGSAVEQVLRPLGRDDSLEIGAV